MLEELVGIDASTTARLLGLLVPLVVAALTKKFASPGLKAVANIVVSAVVGSTVYLVAENGGYDWTGFVNGTLDTFIPSIIAYYGLLKPTGLAGSVTNATSGFGLGKPIMQTDDVGAETNDRRLGDHGAALLGTLGAVLLIVGVVLLLLTLLDVFVVSIAAIVVAIVLGIVLVVLDRGGVNF